MHTQMTACTRCRTANQLPGEARQTVYRLLEGDYLVGKPQGLLLTRDMVQLLVIAGRTGIF